MSELLQTWGYQVLTAAPSRKRHRSETMRRIDIVVSDPRLGERRKTASMPSSGCVPCTVRHAGLLIHGDTSPDEVKRVHSQRAKVLFKPVRTRELTQCCAACVDLSGRSGSMEPEAFHGQRERQYAISNEKMTCLIRWTRRATASCPQLRHTAVRDAPRPFKP